MGLLPFLLFPAFFSTFVVGPFEDVRKCLLSAGLSSEQIIARTNSAEVDGGYAALNYQWNLRPEQKTPLAFLLPRSSREVAAAVRCCKSHGLRVVAKGGGHSVEKYSFGDNHTIVVDLQRLDAIVPDSDNLTCHMGPGVLIGQLAWNLYSEGRWVVPHGVCPSVGMSGQALGGGYGYLSRLHGLTVDNVLEFEIGRASCRERV